MPFSPDPLNQAIELAFAKETVQTNHPVILFSSSPVSIFDQHKHLDVILDSKLSFSSHIQVAVNKAR